MRKLLVILSILGSTAFLLPGYGQSKANPKNLSEAVNILDAKSSDNFKSRLKNTPDKEVDEVAGVDPLLFEWTDWLSSSNLRRYLVKNGISDHQRIVVLLAFKNYLMHKSIDEEALLKPYQEIERRWDTEYVTRFIRDSLRGVYIPKDLDDSMKELDRLRQTKNLPFMEYIVNKISHDIYSWRLNEGSRLSKYFNAYKVNNADDMRYILFMSYLAREKDSTDVNIGEQISKYRAVRKKEEDERNEKQAERLKEYTIGDTVLFLYPFDYVSKRQEERDYDDDCTANGIILAKNNEKFLLKIKVLDACDRRGIIYEDSGETYSYDGKTKLWIQDDRTKKYAKTGDVLEFEYYLWEIKSGKD